MYLIFSDIIEEKMINNKNVQCTDNIFFKKQEYNCEKNVIFDLVDMQRKSRKKLLENFSTFKKIGIFFPQPINILEERNRNKNKEIIKAFDPPLYTEGFNEIQIIKPQYYISILNILNIAFKINQDNPYHNFSIGLHCLNSSIYYSNNEEQNRLLTISLLLHDLGKIYTKTFFNSKGEKTLIAHFYNHEQYGAYLSFLFEELKNFSVKEKLDIAALIRYHMLPYNLKTEESLKRWEKYLGTELFKQLFIMNKFDKMAT